MKFRLRGKTCAHQLESRQFLEHPQGGSVRINDETLNVQWLKQQSVAFVKTNGSPLEKVVRYLAIDRESFAGENESKFQILSPTSGGKWAWASFQAAVDAPGQDQRSSNNRAAATNIRSPMTGKILKIVHKSEDTVKEGDLLMIVEAMKMENKILATRDGVIAKINGEVGKIVNTGDTLCQLKPLSP